MMNIKQGQIVMLDAGLSKKEIIHRADKAQMEVNLVDYENLVNEIKRRPVAENGEIYKARPAVVMARHGNYATIVPLSTQITPANKYHYVVKGKNYKSLGQSIFSCALTDQVMTVNIKGERVGLPKEPSSGTHMIEFLSPYDFKSIQVMLLKVLGLDFAGSREEIHSTKTSLGNRHYHCDIVQEGKSA